MACFSHFPAFLFHVNNYPPKSEWTYDDFTNIARLFSCCKHFVTKTAYDALLYLRGSKHRLLPGFGATKTLRIGLPCPRDGTKTIGAHPLFTLFQGYLQAPYIARHRINCAFVGRWPKKGWRAGYSDILYASAQILLPSSARLVSDNSYIETPEPLFIKRGK